MAEVPPWSEVAYVGASRVWLEAVLRQHLRTTGPDDFTAGIEAELAARTWQWHNPYASTAEPDARSVASQESRHPEPASPATRPSSRHPGA